MTIPALSPAQHRMIVALGDQCRHEQRHHPGYEGGVEWWDIVEVWGRRINIFLVPNAASRCWNVLERLGLVVDKNGLVWPSDLGWQAYDSIKQSGVRS